MKRNIVFFIAMPFIVSCSDNKETAPVKTDVPQASKPVVDTGKQIIFTSLTADELETYLPTPEGFTVKSKSIGESAHKGQSGNIYFSYAKREYVMGNNDYYLEIIDYIDKPDVLQGLLRMYGFDTVINNNEFSTSLVNTGIEKVKAMATTYKTEKTAKLTVSVDNRFIINTTVSGTTDIKGLKKLALAVNLDELVRR